MKEKGVSRFGVLTAAAILLSTTAVCAPTQPVSVLSAMTISASAASVISGAVSHNFTANGLNSNYFDFSGNLSKEKGTMTYNGQTLTQCLKMESATSIAFTTAMPCILTLAVKDGTTLYIDEVKTTIDESGAKNTVVSLDAGAHTIRKGNGTSNLFYIDIAPNGAPVQTTAPQQTTSPNVNTTVSNGNGNVTTQGDIKLVGAGGQNEMLYATLAGVSDAQITAVSYSGKVSGSLTGDDLKYLVRDTNQGARIDIPGVPAGTYQMNIQTAKGAVTIDGMQVSAQDRSGFAHFNYNSGVGAYNNDGTLKSNAIVLYVTNDNKNTVTLKSKDGTSVSGIGNILNSAGKSSKGGKTNTNQGIIQKVAKDGTPLVVRIIGNVTAPEGLTAYDSVDYGGSVGDNGFMARMQSGKDITIEGIGTDACVNGWGFHFIAESSNPDLGESFEVRNITFRNVPEDCVGMEGVQDGSTLTAPVEHCWIHHNEFYKPTIANPAESDKDGGDGACDFKRGLYFTNSYNYYEGYHKTNLIGASDSNLQYHITFHHNYWKNCESRGPLARQANIHMYNNVFQGQTSYCQNPRADAYIFSEYNVFDNCKNPQQIKQGAIKSFHDVLNNCRGDMQATTVNDKNQKVSSNNKYGDFDTNSSLSYIPAGNYILQTDTSKLLNDFAVNGGVLKDKSQSGSLKAGQAVTTTAATTTTTTQATTTSTTTTTVATTTETTTTIKVTTTTTTTTTVTSAELKAEQFGDVDCDSEVNVSDVILLSRYITEDPDAKISDMGILNADCDHNQSVSADDIGLILQFIAKLIPSL